MIQKKETEKKFFETLKIKDPTQKIRVLLMDSDYESYYHKNVVIEYEGNIYHYDKDSKAFSVGNLFFEESEKGIAVSSITRQCGTPVYEGSLTIKKTQDGYLLINELPLETYLQSVIPSEMPSSYEMEALKAQTVCARTYAYRQIQEGRLKEYDADVDDSVQFQVYHNIQPTERTNKAVHETKGQIMFYEGNPIEAYYFSTSSGVTSTDEIWGNEEAAPYLQSVECTFDSMEPWAKWSVELSWSELNDRVIERNPPGGNLRGLEIVKKSASGAVTRLKVLQENDSYEIKNEYDVRSFLSPKGSVIKKNDGTETEGGSLLPSAYFSIDFLENKYIKITGEGYGHGVGMSQNAANQMAKAGYSYQEILQYFFKDISLSTNS